MKSSFKAKVKCAQLGLKYIVTGRDFETTIESLGLLARWKAWPQRCPTKRTADLVVGRAKLRSPSESLFPFRWLVLPPSR
jgi:hypothetical protein